MIKICCFWSKIFFIKASRANIGGLEYKIMIFLDYNKVHDIVKIS